MQRPSNIILASGNQKKLRELSQILNKFSVELVAQTQFDIPEAVEDGLTFVENAIKKARHACHHLQQPAIADDSGIEVDYLKGAPGIYSARYAGKSASDQQNLEKLIEAMQGIPDDQRTARYQCVIVYMQHEFDPTPLICQASWRGQLLEVPRGEGGFGYDPLFFCPQLNKTAAEMTPEEKASVSHRGKALALFQSLFTEIYSQG
ncbi:RdgB/HAM1 family non-canonical purine NTP pyrophosphatase [Aliikangiella maris]|uniref:RdgB/HAM1 family non-canonical purine NTP pyrophosphatase n=2 Tax=Aliikangiella maris TaxID=3162458 RepID=A0ABV2C044_9GAMM